MTKHWQIDNDSNGVRWLSLDKTNSSANVLSQEVLEELGVLINQIEIDKPNGVVIRSAKSSGFILGADISEFTHIETTEQAETFVKKGQILLEKIEELPCPTVAAINGFALGGGLELALACDYRIALKSYDRRLGLPEVQLGIHPGFGGTVRSVRLLGAPLALNLMLNGKPISPIEALRIGLIDELSDPDRINESVCNLLQRSPPKRKAPLHLRILNLKPFRYWLGKRIRAQVARRARPEHYPAPYAIVDLWVSYGASGKNAYEAEARSVGALLVTETSKNLVRVFFLRERLRKLATHSSTVKRVHVVGSGVMGGDIAAWCALKNLTVTLQDRTIELVEPALKKAATLFKRHLKTPGAAAEASKRLIVDLKGNGIAEADIIIEAIIEQLDAKQALFSDLEAQVGKKQILATNTSSIRLEELSEVLADPTRFLGLHFFNPVSRLPLVEVIRSDSTTEKSLNEAMAFVTQIGKLPLPCRSAPGFVVNRILAPYMLEALLALEEGHAPETIDKAAEDFGMPTGPVELADRVGLDIALHVTGILNGKQGAPTPDLLQGKVDAGELGAKTGLGFYKFKGNRPQKATLFTQPDAELQDRLILALINEAMACYEDGIVDELDLLDAGVIFGAGFAPFTGGPIHYARQNGVRSIIEKLECLAAAFGPRFTPNPGWRKLLSET